MGAALGASSAADVVNSIFSRLVSAFQRVFGTVLRFTKPKWVFLFSIGAPILFKYIDNAITIAQNIVSDWSSTVMQTAYNVYYAVLTFLCDNLGCTASNGSCTCNIPVVGGIVSALITQLAALIAGPVFLVALFLKYVVIPLVTWILTFSKNIIVAIYQVVCTVLVPVNKIVMGALAAYYSVTKVRNYMYRAVEGILHGRLTPAVVTIAMPFLAGFGTAVMYDYLLAQFGACTANVSITPLGTGAVTPIQGATTQGMTLATSEVISGMLAPQGTQPAIYTYTISPSELIAASVTASMLYKFYISASEQISALIKQMILASLNIQATEQIAAVLKVLMLSNLTIASSETLNGMLTAVAILVTTSSGQVVWAYGKFNPLESLKLVLQPLRPLITALERYSLYPITAITSAEAYRTYILLLLTALEKYASYIQSIITALESYSQGIPAVITAQEQYQSGAPVVITAQEQYST